MTGKGDRVARPRPRIETTEPIHRYLLGSLLTEVVAVHRGFENWLRLLVAIGAGRLRGRPGALCMHVRHGPTLRTPEGDRSWWMAVEYFGLNCYRLAAARLPPAPVVVDIGANIGSFALALLSIRPQAQVTAYDASPSASCAYGQHCCEPCPEPGNGPPWSSDRTARSSYRLAERARR